jgi:hypothetical protein
MRTLVVNVSQEHIRLGKATRCTRCPIALALEGQHSREGWFWAVFSYDAVYCREEGWASEVYALPETAQYFIQQFDAERSVAPFTFVMRQIR